MLEGFDAIWSVDFEFGVRAADSRPIPVCMCAKEINTGRVIQLWEDELGAAKSPPFDVSERSLLVAYAATAEISCFHALGWPTPRAILDLFFEYRAIRNGKRNKSEGTGLLDAMAHYGLSTIDVSEKKQWQALALRGGPWTAEERAGLLVYCMQDVGAVVALLPRMLPDLAQFRLGQMLLRGRYAAALARFDGIPMDVPMIAGLRDNRIPLITAVVRDAEAKGCDVFDGLALSHERFERWVARRKIPWPRTPCGRLSIKDNATRRLASFNQDAAVLRNVLATRDILSEIGDVPAVQPRGKQKRVIEVDGDGYSRPFLNPFGTLTGRNMPGGDSVFGKAKWTRYLIKPPEGYGCSYLDWVAQEVIVLAAVSQDPNMLADYANGDPYLILAVASGLAPPGATKVSHEKIRSACKIAYLAICYGVGSRTLARETGLTEHEAEQLIAGHEARYAVYHQWRRGYWS